MKCQNIKWANMDLHSFDTKKYSSCSNFDLDVEKSKHKMTKHKMGKYVSAQF